MWPALLLVALFLFASVADASVGTVVQATGDSLFERADATRPARASDHLPLNEVVRTGEDGRLRLALADGSLLSVGSGSELRVVRHDAQQRQTTIELLRGRMLSRVPTIRQAGGGFTIRTPVAIIGVVGTTTLVENREIPTAVRPVSAADLENLPTTRDVTRLLDLIPNRFPGDGTGDANLSGYRGVDSSLVFGVDGVTGVRNVDPGLDKTLYLLPGEAALVERGKVPVKIEPAHLEQVDVLRGPSGTLYGSSCPGLLDLTRIPRGLPNPPKYRIIGKGTSTGQVFEVQISNPDPSCPLDVFIPYGTVLQPTGFLQRALTGLLLGGGPGLTDFQKMMVEGAATELPPAAASAAADLRFRVPAGQELKFPLRGYCLELHKLPPTAETEYRFDADATRALARNRRIMDASRELYYQGATRSTRSTFDSITQWSLWSGIEKLDEKRFRSELNQMLEQNYRAQGRKLDKQAKANAALTADDLWPRINMVLKHAGF